MKSGNTSRRRVMPLGSKRSFAVLVAAIVVVGVVVGAIFRSYSLSLNEEFYKMASESMDDFTIAQKVEVQASFHEVRTTLSAMKSLAETAGIDPAGEMFSSYIESWNKQGTFQISYISITELESQLQDGAIGENDREALARLKAGEDVVSDVRKSNRFGGGYFYSIAEPVIKDGVVQGTLRSITRADELLATSQVSSQVTLLKSVLIKDDGSIVAYSDATEPFNGVSLYSLLKDAGFSADIVKAAQDNVENGEDVATFVLGEYEGKTLFFTSIRLGINGWNIVNITQENTMAQHSQVILHDTVLTSAVLIVISMLACLGVAVAVFRFQRRALREAERYAALSSFSDTVLFEYLYHQDCLEFTPNARELFALKELRRDHYLERNIPLVDVHPDDYGKIRQLIEEPAPADEKRKVVVRARSIAGEYRWYSCECRYLYEGEVPFEAVGKIMDVTQEREAEEQLKRESQVDGLTETLNKVTSQKRIAEKLVPGEEGILFIIDVDRFKLINDELGHSVGDTVLAGVGRALREAFRKEDIVGRMGGDEFIAYASGSTHETVETTKREAVDERISGVSGELGISLSLSVGTARFPENGTTFQELFEYADTAMYEEKRAHKKADGRGAR